MFCKEIGYTIRFTSSFERDYCCSLHIKSCMLICSFNQHIKVRHVHWHVKNMLIYAWLVHVTFFYVYKWESLFVQQFMSWHHNFKLTLTLIPILIVILSPTLILFQFNVTTWISFTLEKYHGLSYGLFCKTTNLKTWEVLFHETFYWIYLDCLSANQPLAVARVIVAGRR